MMEATSEPPSYFPPSPSEDSPSPQSLQPPLLQMLQPPSTPPPTELPPDFTTIVNLADALLSNGDGDDSNAPPDYSRNAAADERIVLAQPAAPRPSDGRTPRTEYNFTSARMELNLGPKKYPVKVPCYGWNQKIEGYAVVKDFKAVTKVTVTLEGSCGTFVMERGIAVSNSTQTLLSETETLWTRPENANGSPTEMMQFPFSFRIPTYSPIEPTLRLPHSYATSYLGFSADVTYNVRVDLFRKGLRRHERLKTMILYLPRSTPLSTPSDPIETPTAIKWESIPITPRCWQNEGHKHSKVLVFGDPHDTVNFILPLPTAYASAAPIPFTLSLPVDSPINPYIGTNLSVQIIKYLIIRASGFLQIREGIIGTGEIWRVEDSSYPTPPPSPSPSSALPPSLESSSPTLSTSPVPPISPSQPSLSPTPESPEAELPKPASSSSTSESPRPTRKVYRGTLKSSREGGESSWNIPHFVEIKYMIRVRIRSPGRVGPDETLVPEYYLDQPITMCTHNQIPNAEDVHDPVLGLIAVPGSEGIPTQRFMGSPGGLSI